MFGDLGNPVGLIGAAVIVLAWIPSTYVVLKKKRSSMNISFCLLFMFGAALLMFYSFQINDWVFGLLNGVAVVFALINLFYIPHKQQKLEKVADKFDTIEEVIHLRDPEYWGRKPRLRDRVRQKLQRTPRSTGPAAPVGPPEPRTKEAETGKWADIEKELAKIRKRPTRKRMVKKTVKRKAKHKVTRKKKTKKR